MGKYLIVGLGNIGEEYAHTRHNIGFDVLDNIAQQNNIKFEVDRLASVARYKFKGKVIVLIKPSTYMNLSGKAIQYWMQQEKVPLENMLVITDDIALPLGVLRLKGKGGDGGHNGLKNTQEILNTQNYARLRFGVGNEFSRGKQVDFVLGKWTKEEDEQLKARIPVAAKIVESFVAIGLLYTMNAFNNK